MSKKLAKNLLAFFLLAGGLVFARLIFAQDFGTEAVNNGLNGGLASGDPREIAGRIINFALGFLGIIAVGLILYSGFLWMTAAGNEDKVEEAKKILKNGVIGLVIILSSWAIATFILTKLGGAVSGNPTGCYDGETQSCGCGGSMACSSGVWSGCVGSDLNNCITPPASCDASPNPGCQAVSQICAAGYFCDTSCLCQNQGEAGDSCDADLTNQTCDADNNRCSEYLTCNPDTCLCSGPPVITGISPVGGFCNLNFDKPCALNTDCAPGDTCNLTEPNGAPKNFITIFGKNFGEYSATTSQVVFLGNNAPVAASMPTTINSSCIDTWRDDQIIVAVTTGVQTGPVRVVNNEGLQDETNNQIGPQLGDFITNNITRPGLCYLNPNQGILSSEVGYQGINLFSGKAYFGNYENNVRGLDSTFNNPAGLSGTSTTPNIQAGTSGSFVEKVIAGFPQKSNFLRFTKDKEIGEGPYIISFSPTAGAPGQYVTIRGAGFGGARGNNHVYFSVGSFKTEASYVFPAICSNSVWKDNQIIVKVPEGPSDDSYQIEINLGSSTISTLNLNPNSFNIDRNLALKSSLCKIDPEQGPIDTPVTLWGEYFGAVGSNGLVRFNYNQDANGTIAKENDANTIKTSVPKTAFTGPVRVIKDSEWGNELNFTVGECANNSECNNQICCPENTYKKGRCVASIDQCFVEVPTSVFEWGFSTSFAATTTPAFDSCLGLSQYLGTCYQGGMCPNSPGSCSSPSTSYQKTVGECDMSCQGVPGCTATTCVYNDILDKCVQNIAVGNCSLPQTISYTLDGKTYQAEQTCNSNKKWEIVLESSCPIGWTRETNNRCVQDSSSCNICASNLDCNEVNSIGRCMSDKLCTDEDAKCIDNQIVGEADKCVIEVAPSCECCCRIGKEAEDCCAGLSCTGKCGSDLVNHSNTYGSCSGCAAAGSTTEEHDAACNCSGHTSQFCEKSTEHPEGICSDCSGIKSQEICGDHSSACCFDSNRTASASDDICRGVGGGTVVSSVKGSTDYGYCAYFNCFSETVPPIGDPLICASTTPVKIGYFNKVDTCIGDCPEGIGSDPCRAFDNNKDYCAHEDGCCFDATRKQCISGEDIEQGDNDGYCAYYECQTPPGDPSLCNLTPTTTPIFSSTTTCTISCANPPGGAGLDCSDNVATSTCNFGLCNFTGFACLKDTGAGGAFPDCGTCCCQVGSTPDSCVSALTPNLHCQADKGSCSGADRGLCCGCTSDGDCGSINTTGCGMDTCCEARPTVASSSPAAAATNVCRNASLQITFNQNMDLTSFGNNFILFEERSFGNGICPEGTYITDAGSIKELINSQRKNIFARLWSNLSTKFGRLFGTVNEQALATPPDPAKLYCAIPGTTSAEENGKYTKLIFTPTKILAPATKYYAVVRGDELLNSKSGILSFSKIGMNERGLDEGDGTFIPSNLVNFNKKSYQNSYSFQFTTLSDQGLNAGVCALDNAIISPSSYLFKTTVNDVNEKDDNIADRTFDTKADRDKVLSVGAYSSDGQLLHPIIGYAWDWVWSSDNLSVARVIDLASGPPFSIINNRKLIQAQPNITDGQTKINAVANMNAYRPSAGCGASCNAYFSGDGEVGTSDIYVFMCDNPWPAPASNGTWFPWNDSTGNCSINPVNCENFNYKFYYCRDSGSAGTLDDLPAIDSSPVVRGQGSNLLCSSDKTPCTTYGSVCGIDQNGDGSQDGLCFWNVLKESYFMREVILNGAEIIAATDTKNNGEVHIDWRSAASGVGSYKIYYLKSGKGAVYTKEVTAASACTQVATNYICGTKINGLTNDQPYVFKITVISTNKTESALSNEKTATPTDETRPSKPVALNANINIHEKKVNFNWDANPLSENVSFYRLYLGATSGLYGESFDSAPGSTSLSLQLPPLSNTPYASLTAISSNNHESDKSDEIIFFTKPK